MVHNHSIVGPMVHNHRKPSLPMVVLPQNHRKTIDPNGCPQPFHSMVMVTLKTIESLWWLQKSVLNRARWFQLFVIESFGQLSDHAGYREKHFRLYGFGLGGLLYPPEALPMWQNFSQRVQKQVFGIPAAYIWSDACHIHPNFLSYQEKHYGWDE